MKEGRKKGMGERRGREAGEGGGNASYTQAPQTEILFLQVLL